MWGQCSDAMQTRIQESASYETVHRNKHAIGLIKIIKAISFNYQAHQEPVVALDSIKVEFYKLFQGKHQSVQEYYDTYKNMVKVNHELGAKVGLDKGLLEIIAVENNKTVTGLSSTEADDYTKAGQERYLAIRMLCLLYTSPSPRDLSTSRMPSSA